MMLKNFVFVSLALGSIALFSIWMENKQEAVAPCHCATITQPPCPTLPTQPTSGDNGPVVDISTHANEFSSVPHSTPTPETPVTPATPATPATTPTPETKEAAKIRAEFEARKDADAADLQRRSAFTDVYTKNTWNNPESRSGAGSTMHATQDLRQWLSLVFSILEATQILDAPCGDVAWQPAIPGFSKLNYTGVDIVPPEIDANAKKFADKPNMRFKVMDLVTDRIDQAYDVIICKEALQHLPAKDALRIVQNFEASGSKYLISTFYRSSNPAELPHNGQGVSPGHVYDIDLEGPPFNFPPPIARQLQFPTQWHVAMEASWGNINPTRWEGVWELPVIGRGSGRGQVLNRWDLDVLPPRRRK